MTINRFVSSANVFPKVTHPFCRLPLLTFFDKAMVYKTWEPDADIGTDKEEGSL